MRVERYFEPCLDQMLEALGIILTSDIRPFHTESHDRLDESSPDDRTGMGDDQGGVTRADGTLPKAIDG